MEFEKYLNYLRELQEKILNYIDDEDQSDENYEYLIDFFNDSNIPKSREEFLHLINLLLIIANNYHRVPDFFNKIVKILLFFKTYIKSTFSNQEIFDIFKDTKPILYFLFEHEFLVLDKPLLNLILLQKDLYHYLFPIIKTRLNKKKKQKIENEMPLIPFDNTFIEKCKIGENDSDICNFIRKDLIDEFIIYITKKDTKLTNQIKSSIFESNSFLINKYPTLIEYAAFHGSIEVFQYLRLNNVDLNSTLWLYAIHGKNAEIIHFLEEDRIEPPNNSYEEIYKESIKCHHNDIAEYILNNYILTKNETVDYSTIFQYYNFHFFPEDFAPYTTIPLNEKIFNILNLDFVMLKLTIPSTETIIKESMFKSFISIKEITIPSSIVSIKKSAFQGCLSLTSLNFSDDSKLSSIGSFSFSDCASLVELKIPPKVEFIEVSAFKGCTTLRSVYFPSSVQSIGSLAFQRCSSLEIVVFEEKSQLKSIGSYAFNGCNKIKNVSIPSSVNSIGEGAWPYKLHSHVSFFDD